MNLDKTVMSFAVIIIIWTFWKMFGGYILKDPAGQ
jgi:hypothetical protein